MQLNIREWRPETYRKFRRGRCRQYVGQRNFRAVMHFAERFLQGCVLDAGCGDGAMVRALRRWKPSLDVVGVDLAPSPGPGILKADLARLPFERETFDCVLCMDVLEHLAIEDCPLILTEIRRVMKARAYLCVTAPNQENLDAAMMLCPHCDGWFHPRGHTRKFSAEDLRHTLDEGGFKSVTVRSYGLDAYYHFGAMGGLVSAIGRVVFPKMHWDEWLFAHASKG